MEHGIGILGLEKTGTRIEHTLRRIHLLRFPGRWHSLDTSYRYERSVNEHWVKLGGIGCNGDNPTGTRAACCCHLHIIVESKPGLTVYQCLPAAGKRQAGQPSAGHAHEFALPYQHRLDLPLYLEKLMLLIGLQHDKWDDSFTKITMQHLANKSTKFCSKYSC